MSFLVTFMFFILMICVSCTKQVLNSPEDIPCVQNSDCVLISKNCCPCNMGGAPYAIHKLQKEAYRRYRDQTCHSGREICLASYRCDEWKSSTLQCVNSRCTVEIYQGALP
ncbi:MAG: hypothetical protein OXH36_01955 [Bdellovibrionales bacterium]|nr:hypothetical protein [Bdellovibrionales bacterium]